MVFAKNEIWVWNEEKEDEGVELDNDEDAQTPKI